MASSTKYHSDQPDPHGIHSPTLQTSNLLSTKQRPLSAGAHRSDIGSSASASINVTAPGEASTTASASMAMPMTAVMSELPAPKTKMPGSSHPLAIQHSKSDTFATNKFAKNASQNKAREAGETSTRRLNPLAFAPAPAFVRAKLAGGAKLTGPQTRQKDHERAEMLKHWQTTMDEDEARERFAVMLKKLKIFRSSSTPFLQVLATKLRPYDFEEGEDVMKQGDYGDWMCICLKGCCDVKINMAGKTAPQKVGEFRPGKYVGEIAMMGISMKRMATITATKPTLLLALTRDDLEASLTANPWELPNWQHILCQPLHIDKNNLSETKFFSQLSSVFVDRIEKHLAVKLFYTDEYLMKEGEYGCEMYVLRRGTVGIYKGQPKELIIELSDAGVIGEMAVLGSDRRSASVMCHSLCVTQVLHGDVFNHILDEYPEERSKFDAHVMRRLVGQNRENMQATLRHYDEFYGKIHPPSQAVMKKLQEKFPLLEKDATPAKARKQRPATAGGESKVKPRTFHVVCSGIPNIDVTRKEYLYSDDSVERPSTAPPATRAPRRTMGFADQKAVARKVAEVEGKDGELSSDGEDVEKVA